jgi:hypothetical protein
LFVFREGKPVTARIGHSTKVHGKRWSILVGSVALGAAALGLSSCGFPSATAATQDPSGSAVVECSSGIVTQGDVQTSSLFVAKVPAGEHPDTPGGCTVLTG